MQVAGTPDNFDVRAVLRATKHGSRRERSFSDWYTIAVALVMLAVWPWSLAIVLVGLGWVLR